MSLYKLLNVSKPQFPHVDVGLLWGMHVVGSEEMAAILWFCWQTTAAAEVPVGPFLHTEHCSLLTSTCSITPLLLRRLLAHVF